MTQLAPGESIILSDLTELAEELGRYDDLRFPVTVKIPDSNPQRLCAGVIDEWCADGKIPRGTRVQVDQ